jgi:hypothetical protein
MTYEIRKWRKAAFIHMDKKNDAIRELEDTKETLANMQDKYSELYAQHMYVLFLALVVSLCLFFSAAICK